ncbi:MAG TPA: mechanosensitive ion channel family protein, partial [Candidatus Aenigmarchaeota archaeon]|nr:mechanosensitive ion channel family protein [Candidatus Aenigmarchaeota archaeon]
MFEFITQYLPYSNAIESLLILFLFLVIAKIVSFAFKKTVHRLTAKTKTILDDLLIGAINLPLILGIILLGIYYAILNAPVLSGYLNYVTMGFTALFIILGAITLTRIINAFIEWYMTEIAVKTKTKADEQFIPIIRKVAYGVVGIVSLLWILNQFGVEITTLVATLGIGGLAVALALQDTLKEFFAGTYVILDRPIRIGDYIELESGERGYVTDISWRSTRLRLLGDNVVIIPNSKLASSKIINYDLPKKEMSVVIPVGVSYDSDLEKVERVTIKVAKEVMKKTPGAKEDFEPFIRYNEFGDSNINFSVILRVKTFVDRYLLTHQFIKALKKEYDKHGIEISWPV